MTLTHTTAVCYVEDLLAEWKMTQVNIVEVTLIDLDGAPAFNVEFTGQSDIGWQTGTFIVWLEPNGVIYGEW